MYLEKRRRLYYAVLTIPKEAREKLNNRLRFIKSTGTEDKRKAQLIAYQYVAGWQVEIDNALGIENGLLAKAIAWRNVMQSHTSEDDIEVITDIVRDEAITITDSKGYIEAENFYGIAMGTRNLTITTYEQWKAQLSVVPKSIDQMSRDVALLVDKFTTVEDITHNEVFKWVEALEAEGKTVHSRHRILKGCKNYWNYLKSKRIVPSESNPFANLISRARGKVARKVKTNAPYTPDQVATLYYSALSQTRYGKNPYSDQQLADLILLSAYTGTRIEELCSLKLEDVKDDCFNLIDSKTEAGIREVPIHSHLSSTVARLIADSTDGYLMSGLPADKYNKRSGVMCKRFSVLKTKLGFPPKLYTAHSFRSTLATMLENTGIPENVAADILGHVKKTMTYGLYSGGATLAIKKQAIELIRYPINI